MSVSNYQLEDLAQATVERLMWDIQALIDQYGPEKGQDIAEKTLVSIAKMALNDAPQMQPMSDLERRAVAYAVKLALATVKADEKSPN